MMPISKTAQDWPASGIAPVIIEAGERETFAGTNMGRRRELALQRRDAIGENEAAGLVLC